MSITQKIALIAAIVLPFWNIPLIIRIVKRKSSADISIFWVMGVWVCFLLMAPEGFRSEDIVWRMFNIVNMVLFTAVAITVLSFRPRQKRTPKKD